MTEIETFDLQGNSLGLTENHLNLQYAYGDGAHTSCRLMEEAVSRLLYQVPIQGYCALNMDAMPVLADSVDGVEITVPDNSLAEVDPSFVQGAQVTITGENAETFLRPPGYRTDPERHRKNPEAEGISYRFCGKSPAEIGRGRRFCHGFV